VDFVNAMTETCSTCDKRILSDEKRLRYYETDDGLHKIGNFVTPIKRSDGALNYSCRSCHKKAKLYVCFLPVWPWDHFGPPDDCIFVLPIVFPSFVFCLVSAGHCSGKLCYFFLLLFLLGNIANSVE
jgi:hypothetical protein